MNKRIITFTAPQPKQRNHYVLFAEDTPFKPKSVKRKDGYRRKPKFVNRDTEYQ